MTTDTDLEKLSAEATEGEWFVDPDDRPGMEWNFHICVRYTDKTVCFMAHDGGAKLPEANAAFIVALVNAYRSGELVSRSGCAEDDVERAAIAMFEANGGKSDSPMLNAYQNEARDDQRMDRYRKLAKAALGVVSRSGWRDGEPIKLKIAAVQRIHAEVRRRERERCIALIEELSKDRSATWGSIVSSIRAMPDPEADTSQPDLAGRVGEEVARLEHDLGRRDNDIGLLISTVEWLLESTGETLDHEDSSIFSQIKADLRARAALNGGKDG